MDARVAGAGIAVALGMMLLLPTFNALNNSYVENVAPPPWMPMPEEIPEDFQPPPDWKPPEGWVPPEDFEPPPGWEPPPGYDGPIPPGGCPPPVIRKVEGMEHTRSLQPPSQGPWTWEFDVPQYTLAIGANATFTNWQAQRIVATLTDPNATSTADEELGSSGGLLVPASTTSQTILSVILQPSDPQDVNTWPASGTYSFEIRADVPIQGTFRTSVEIMLPCGGLLE